ncbi:MAG: hypothetical protein J6D04_01750, partial [Clostridia bacterium]|nr:hypothetical protein [Clostridia bacterium]
HHKNHDFECRTRKRGAGILDGFQDSLTQLCAKIMVFGRFIPKKHRRWGAFFIFVFFLRQVLQLCFAIIFHRGFE